MKNKKPMTKAQALKTFQKFCSHAPKGMDIGWKGIAWYNYTDMLYETDKITERQWDTWKNPF